MSQSQSAWDQAGKVKKGHKRRRIVVAVVTSVLAVLALLVIFAPAIASPIARSIIEDKASSAIAGRVEVDAVHLSWFGSQSVEGLRLYQPDNTLIVDADVNAGVGLLSLATGGRDLGTITVSGKADIRRAEDGAINLIEATKPTAPSTGGGQGGGVPKNLHARLDLSAFDVTYSDPMLRSRGLATISIQSLKGAADFAPGTPLTFDVQGSIAAAGSTEKQGQVQLSGSIADLVDASGAVTTDQATVDAGVKADALNAGLFNRLVDAPIDAAKAAGSPVELTLSAKGPLLRPDATMLVQSSNVQVQAKAGFEDQALVLREPATVQLARAALEAVDKAWLADKAGGSLEVNAMPQVALTVSSLRVPMQDGGKPAIDASVELGALDAMVQVGDGSSAVQRRITTEPATFTFASQSVPQSFRAQGSLAFNVDGSDAGTLVLDLAATDLEAGQPNAGPQLPPLRGTLALRGMNTAVVQPFVAASGVDMSTDVGPSLNLALELTPEAGTTALHGTIESSNVNGQINLAVAGARITGTELPSQIRVSTLGPLLSRKLADAGLCVQSGASLDVNLQQIDVDLSRALDGGSLTPADVTARAEVAVGPTSGQFVREGVVRPFTIEQVGTLVQFAGPARSAQVRLATGGTVDNQPAGNVAAEFRIDEFLPPDGSWSVGLPTSIRGRAELTQLATSLADPFVKLEGTSLRELVGPTVDLIVEASPEADQVTHLTLQLTSQQLTGDGGLLLSPDALAVDASGLTFTHAGVAPLAAQFASLGEDFSIRREGGAVEVGIYRLQLPLDPQTRSPRLDALDANARVVVRNLFIDQAGARPADQFEVRNLVIRAQQKPGSPASIDLSGLMFHQRQQFRAEGAFEVPGLMPAVQGNGGFDVATLKPSGSLKLTDVPSSLLAEGIRLASIEGLDAATLATGIAGQTLSAQVDLKTVDQTLQARATSSGSNFNLTAEAALADTLQSATLDADLTLTEPVGRQLTNAFLPDMADSVALVGQNALHLHGALTPDGAIDARINSPGIGVAGLEDRPVRVTFDASARTPMTVQPQAARPVTITFESNVQDPAGNAVAQASGNVDAQLLSGEAPALNGRVRATGLRTAWFDKLLGSGDLYQGALGNTLAVTADAALDQATQATKLTADVQAPNLQSTSKLAATLRSGAVVLDQPYSATWTGDGAWLSRRMSSMGDKAPTINAPVVVQIDLRQLSLPPSTKSVPDVVLTLDLAARVPQVAMTMPGGEKRAYTGLVLTAKNIPENTGFDANLVADLTINNQKTRAVDVTAMVRGLSRQNVLTPDRAFLNADATIQHVPTSIVDAFVGSGGTLVDMLGPEVAIEELKVRRAPLEGGTVAFKARSAQAVAVLGGTFKDAQEDGQLVDGYFVVNEGSYVELSSFDTSFTKKVLDVVPIFGSLKRTEESDRPSRVTIQSMRLPMEGGLQDINFNLSADLGSVQYGLSGPLETALKWSGQKSMGQLGARLDPFSVSMADGVVRYDGLSVPIGEFNFNSNGSINLINKTKDLLILMPAGAFAVEAFGLQGVMADFVNNAVKVPMNNAGAIDAKNWKPDFSKAQGQLFKPEKILDEGLRKGIGNLLKPGGQSGGGGGAGGGAGGGG